MFSDGRRCKYTGFEVCAGPNGDFTFETRIVAQNPAVTLLSVAERVAGEPFDAELGVGRCSKVGKVAEDEDGGVGGANDGDLGGFVGGDGGGEFCGGECGVEVNGVEV